MKRVTVFTMHESDRATAQAGLTNVSTTEGYVVGDADEAKIAELKAAGLIVNEVEVPPPAIGLHAAAGGAAPEFPSYHIVWLQKPVLPEYHAQLEAAGLELQEVRGNRHVFHVSDAAQLAALQAFPFVSNVQFDQDDALKSKGGNTLTARWDLMLHDGASPDALRKWLDENEIQVWMLAAAKKQKRAFELVLTNLPDHTAEWVDKNPPDKNNYKLRVRKDQDDFIDVVVV